MRKILFAAALGLVGWAGAAMAAPAVSIVGTWAGALSLAGTRLPVVFHISQAGQGWKATMDSPNQGVRGIPVNEVDWSGGKLTLISDAVGGHFDGSLDPAGDQITGTWTQGPYSLPLALHRTSDTPPLGRPQTAPRP